MDRVAISYYRAPHSQLFVCEAHSKMQPNLDAMQAGLVSYMPLAINSQSRGKPRKPSLRRARSCKYLA